MSINSINNIVSNIPVHFHDKNANSPDQSKNNGESPQITETQPDTDPNNSVENQPSENPGKDLTASEQKTVDELQQRDKKVKAHEAAHVAAGGKYITSGASFDYERGADGVNYAVGGEVGIDLSEVKGDPAATVRKMQTVRNAALAPADPSSQDRAVAAKAMQKAAEAQMEIALESEEGKSTNSVSANQNTEEVSEPTEKKENNSAITQYTQQTTLDVKKGGLIDLVA